MAIAYRAGPDNEVALQLQGAVFDPIQHRLTLVVSGQGGALEVTGVADNGWLRLANPACAIERMLVAHPQHVGEVWVTDAARSQRLHVEPLSCHTSFFAPVVDFAAAAGAGYDKPGLLAVFTNVYNDPLMLRLWERHYLRLVAPEHLYVIDHGSSPACEVRHPGIQVVRLPRGLSDQDNVAHFCNAYQRFLLTQYRWVLHVDSDELLVPADGVQAFLQRLATDEWPAGTALRPDHAVEVLPRSGVDGPISLGSPIGLQRPWGVPHPDYRKPALASGPLTWGPGFHYALEDHRVVTDERLWLIHLAKMDVDITLERNRKWHANAATSRDLRRRDHSHRLTRREALVEEFDAMCARGFALPDEVAKGF